MKDNKSFVEAQKHSIRRRLRLRENDVVEIREGMTLPVSQERVYNMVYGAIALDCKDADMVAKTIIARLLDHFRIVETA